MAVRQLSDGLEMLDAPVIPAGKEALDRRTVGDDDDVLWARGTIKSAIEGIEEQCHAVIDICA